MSCLVARLGFVSLFASMMRPTGKKSVLPVLCYQSPAVQTETSCDMTSRCVTVHTYNVSQICCGV